MQKIEKSIVLMPESAGNTLCVKFSGLVNRADHDAFVEEIAKAVSQYGTFNLLVYYDSFLGWEPEAADSNMRGILEFGKKSRRLAYVNPPEKKIVQHKITPEFFGEELKYFDEDQLAEAIAWVKGKPG